MEFTYTYQVLVAKSEVQELHSNLPITYIYILKLLGATTPGAPLLPTPMQVYMLCHFGVLMSY